MPEFFSLKDHLFHPAKIEQLSIELKTAWQPFPEIEFTERIISALPALELKQRIAKIRQELHRVLPQNYPEAVQILLKALPDPCDPELSDDDFGDFIYAPFSDFVAHYGCSRDNFKLSMEALREMTTRFSAEDAIRPFLSRFPRETQKILGIWAQDSHYHVRRLVSEGTRPSLPWSQKLDWPPEQALALLDLLYADPTRYVTRSVANHLNDWSKKHPDLVVARLKQWRKTKQQSPKEMDYIERHALRSLSKQGHAGALELLGFCQNPQFDIQNLKWSPKVSLGEYLSFDFTLLSQKQQALMLDFRIAFLNAKGEHKEKVFKIKQVKLQSGESIQVRKRHLLRQMTTKKLYPGPHYFALQINGKLLKSQKFDLC